MQKLFEVSDGGFQGRKELNELNEFLVSNSGRIIENYPRENSIIYLVEYFEKEFK